jgi:shikimate kinase
VRLSGPIIIVGFMGCGKTAVAHCLAAQLNISIVDLDEAITERVGRSPAQLISEDGEPAFRNFETKVLRELLAKTSAGVISLGGGAWIEVTNRQLVAEASATTFWLDTPFDLCWERIVSSGGDRPLGRTREQAEKLFEIRQPVYELATIRIRTTVNDTPEDLAARIATFSATQR